MGDFKRRAVAFVVAAGFCVGATAVSCGGDDDSASDADATPDVVRHFDAAEGADAGEDANTCAPTAPPGWPVWVPPNPRSSACTTAQVQALYDACYAGGTPTACNAFYGDPANSPCITCMSATQEGDPTYGPIVNLYNNTTLPNVGGCIALIDGDLSATGCGAQYQEFDLCPEAACAPNCLIDDSTTDTANASFDAFYACGTKAFATVCKSFQKPACAKDPKYAPCMFVSYESQLKGLGAFACASGSADASSDADVSDAASADD